MKENAGIEPIDEVRSLRQKLNELHHVYREAPVGLCYLDRDLRYVRSTIGLRRSTGCLHHPEPALVFSDIHGEDEAGVGDDVVGQMAGLVRVTLRHRKVSLTCKVPSDLWTWGDGGELQQVLINLVLNAADAMIPKGGQVTIRGYRETDATITLEVRDDGPGIPETIQGKIFEPFFTTKSSGTGGDGVGAVDSPQYRGNHGGKLTVESSSQGATFRVSLPAEVESAIEGATDQEVNAASAQGAKSELRVLVLDDDEFVLKIIRRLMESVSASQNLGWVVTATASPKEALQILRDTPHDVLLTDFLMDELNGIEVMEAAKKIQPEIVSVLMSGYADNFRKETPPGFLDVLDKPLDMDDVRDVMDRAWDTIRARSDDD